MTGRDGALYPLERWTPTLYLVAGTVLILFPTNTALKTFTGTSYPVVGEIVAPAGFLIGVFGLLGLYPALADRTPRLARVAGVIAALSAADWGLIILKNAAIMTGLLPEIGALTAVTGIVAVSTTMLSYGIFGVAGVRTGVYQPWVRRLMMLEGLVFIHVFIILFASISIPLYLLEIFHVITHLGIGITLWTNGTPSDRAEPAADATAGL